MAGGKTKKVLVSFRIVNAPGVETFSGAIRGLRSFAKWNVRLFTDPLRLTAGDVAAAPANGVNGILVNHPLQEDLTAAFLASDVPLVVLGNTDQRLFRRRRNVAFAETDNRKVGEMAADYFLSLGKFRSYAFLPDIPSSRWSRLRLRGFRQRLRAKGASVAVFSEGDVATWLSSLGKPVALLLAGDYLASDAMSACETAGLAIPSDVSVLGVDNNPTICESTPVSLSSIEPDFPRTGFDAVRLLDRMMCRKKPLEKPLIQRTAPVRVVERASTVRTRPSAGLVERAMRFIGENVDGGISAGDVAKHLGVSPQLLALRFAQLEHRSVRDVIIEIRLAKVKRLLASTQMPVAVVAARCGFKSASHFAHQFSARVGLPPGAWRMQSRPYAVGNGE